MGKAKGERRVQGLSPSQGQLRGLRMLNAHRNLLPCSQFSSSFSLEQHLSVWNESGAQGGVWEEGCASVEVILSAPPKQFFSLEPPARAPSCSSPFFTQISTSEHSQNAAPETKTQFPAFCCTSSSEPLQSLETLSVTQQQILIPLPAPAPALQSHTSQAHSCSSLIDITPFLFQLKGRGSSSKTDTPAHQPPVFA